MFRNQFVVAVLCDGKVLRESGNEVFLPFGSEYVLRLKNNSGVKAVATIEIDGTDAMGDSEIIVPAFGSVDLERFMVDGDMKAGKKFKFVSANDSRVQDPSSAKNGCVRVTFTPEHDCYIWTTGPEIEPAVFKKWEYDRWETGFQPYRGTINTSGNINMSCCRSSTKLGATISGGHSSQQFVEGHVGLLDQSKKTTIELWLRGKQEQYLNVPEPVTVQGTRNLYCVSCGTKSKQHFKFCPKCGTKLEKETYR